MSNGCTAPCNLWQLLHDLTYSVTFDLSHKANKEKTSAVLAWQKTMRANFELPAEDQYRDLLSLLK